MPFTGYFEMQKHARRVAMWEHLGLEQNVDAALVINGVKLPVHSMVLASESMEFRKVLQNRRTKNEYVEIDLGDVNIHSIWRFLELVYCRSYTTRPCPQTTLHDNENEINKHLSVYELARRWCLPKTLQEEAYTALQKALQREFTTEEFLAGLDLIVNFPPIHASAPIEKGASIKDNKAAIIMAEAFSPKRKRGGSL